MRNSGISLIALAVVAFMSLSPLGADPVIQRGIDTFTTTANGKTYYDFSHNPIPANFFCKGSASFTGRVPLKGLPIETAAPGELRNADTVVERLDDAVFDVDGTAVTRIRFRALSMVSVAPIKTVCGAFHVYVSLADEQPVTTMRIQRTQESGGTFFAPFSINARISFIPVKPARGKSPRKLELAGRVTFPGTPIPWSFSAGAATKRIGSVFVDTNGDMAPDTRLSGTSNFFPGWSSYGVMEKLCYLCEPEVCHTDSGEQHCTGPIKACNGAQCP